MKFYLAILMLISALMGSLKSMEEPEKQNNLIYSVEQIYKSIRKCSCVNTKFACYNDMLTHIYGCHVSFNSNEYICNYPGCKVKTSLPETLILHFPEHTREVIKICSGCHFNITMQLGNHDAAHHIYGKILNQLSKKDLMFNDEGTLRCPECNRKYVKLICFLKHLNSHPKFNMKNKQERNFFGELKKQKPNTENSPEVIEITPANIELLFLEEYYLNSGILSYESDSTSDSIETQSNLNSSEELKVLEQHIITHYGAIENNDYTEVNNLNGQLNQQDLCSHNYGSKKRKISHENN